MAKTLSDLFTMELAGIESPPVRRGRKPKGSRTMTDAERAASYRERKRTKPNRQTPIPDDDAQASKSGDPSDTLPLFRGY